MSEYTDFYVSWLGNASFGSSGIRYRDQEPLVFKPTDISGCLLWLDANNNDVVQYNDLLQVSSWSNQGTLGGQFDLSGAGQVSYGNTAPNGLHTVTFESEGFMSGVLNIPSQSRSVFYVVKPNTLAAFTPVFTSDTTGHQEIVFDLSGTWTTYMAQHGSPFPEIAFETSTDYTGYPYITSLITSTDLSDNWSGYNGTYTAPIYQSAAAFSLGSATYFLGNYLSGSPVQANFELCELIIYEGALPDSLRIEVEKYLRIKWAIVDPPPPPPPAFVPTDISGLWIWMDGANSNSWTIDGMSNVTAWSNLGLASNVFSNGCNYAQVTTDPVTSQFLVAFPSQTTMDTYAQLPYTTRTAFVAFQVKSDLSTITYPYVNLWNTDVETGMQMGFSWDSNNSNYSIAMCQQAQNCPIIGPIYSLTSNLTNLAIFAIDASNQSNSLGYWNGGSNINTSPDIGNLFSTNPIPYSIGSPVTDSPSYAVNEILEYNSLLTTNEISTVANYLVTKWAISSFVPFA